MPQLASMTSQSGELLYFKCPYHAKVMNRLDAVNRTIGSERDWRSSIIVDNVGIKRPWPIASRSAARPGSQKNHKRTGMPLCAKNFLTSPTVYSPKWKMLAANTASAFPSRSTAAMCSSRPAAPVREDFPTIRRDSPRVDGDHDALAAEFFRAGANQVGRGDSRGIDADFVRAGLEHRVHVRHGSKAAANCERHKTLVGGALDDLHDCRPAMRAGGDVEEDHLVGALVVVADRQVHRITHVAQLAGLRPAELDAAGHLAGMHVEAGNDAAGEHVGKAGRGGASWSLDGRGELLSHGCEVMF